MIVVNKLFATDCGYSLNSASAWYQLLSGVFQWLNAAFYFDDWQKCNTQVFIYLRIEEHDCWISIMKFISW